VATKARKTREGVKVTLDTTSGLTITRVVPHRQVDYARRAHFKYREEQACGSQVAGWWDFFRRRALIGCDNQKGGLHLGGDMEEAFVVAFEGRFERGL
jgi:hypothetical protein